MKPFLREVAQDLYRSYGSNLQELCLVFPNRRAGLFFNKYLGEQLDKPVWSPTIYTIQDLMSRISDLEYADDLELISTLYQAYSRVREREESFDDFFFWGEIMLSDFDELDKYLVDAEDIFRNISDLKDLEGSFEYLSEEQLELINRFWSTFDPAQLSEQKHLFLEVWNILHPVYEMFRDALLASGTGYEGMIFRNVAESIAGDEAPDLPFTNFAFIGFNALNACEKVLFRSLQKAGRASFYWDYDDYYLGNEMHEAGRFIRQNLSIFEDSGKNFRQENLAAPDKQIQVYSVPSDAGQAQIVYSILEKARQEMKLGEETAVVLADEELLIPVLNALPGELEEINVTMGYPVTATPVFSLIEHLITLQRNFRGGGENMFYHADVLPLVQHQYISLRQKQDAAEIVRDINRNNLIYIPANLLARNDLFEMIFRKLGKPEEIAGYLLSVLELITGTGGEEEKPVPAMELEFIYRIYTRIKRLKDILGRLELNFTLPTFLRLYHKFLQRTRIPFSGEPLAGIQVMGVLETRVLDFDRIILLSMNEGAFPRTGTSNSFIPHNLRLGFQLPTLEYQDAIYAYYFYRLIHRPGDIHLVYNNKAEGLNTGEKSRYIYQLKYDQTFNLTECSAGFDIHSSGARNIRVDKTDGVMDVLRDYCSADSNKYLSPSALNSYIDCPLQFYFNYIAGIREPEELLEEVDPALFGTLLHESVRKIYQSMDNPVEKAGLDRILGMQDFIRNTIDETFNELWLKDSRKKPEGRNRVIREIIFTYATRILEKDKEYCPIHIQSLEDDYYIELPVRMGQQENSVRLGGKIDRIDQLDASYRVLDYKTGNGRMYFSSVDEIFDPEANNRNRAAFQTMLYAKLFLASVAQPHKPVIPGVYLIRDIFNDGFRYHFGIGTARKNTPLLDYSELDEEFTRGLSTVLNQLFDREIPFSQTSRDDICRNCLYRGLCHR